jgi:hypothetical protein
MGILRQLWASAPAIPTCWQAAEQGWLDHKARVAYDDGVNSILLSHPVSLLADAGVPMIFITLPGMIVLLLPIIVAETVVVVRRTSLPKTRTLWVTAAANLASTIVGVPLTWGVLFLCELGLFEALAHTTKFANSGWNSPIARIVGTIFSAPWLAPVSDRGSWAVPLATLVLLIPFFFVSVWVEQKVTEQYFSVTSSADAQPNEVNAKVLRRAVRDANLMSYGFLFAFATVWLFWGAFHR